MTEEEDHDYERERIEEEVEEEEEGEGTFQCHLLQLESPPSSSSQRINQIPRKLKFLLTKTSSSSMATIHHAADIDNGVDRLIRKIHSWLHRSPPPGPVSFLRHFPYKEIKRATDGFCRIIYNSSHGAAYKARFRDGRVALVKEIKDFEQTKGVFYREVQLLGRLHHRHLLPLIGFSLEQKSMLVFENIENGSLKDHLNDPLRTPLNWRTRRQIAVGVAAALEYLLLFNDPPIYHVSISSSNIMLDENFTAKLSDVGFLGSYANSIKARHTKCSEECNDIIFQLGVLILELITGQSSEEGGFDLIQWVQENRLGGSIHNLIDPDLGNDYNSRELKNLLDVARACIKSRDKPVFSAAKLLRYLQKKIDTPT